MILSLTVLSWTSPSSGLEPSPSDMMGMLVSAFLVLVGGGPSWSEPSGVWSFFFALDFGITVPVLFDFLGVPTGEDLPLTALAATLPLTNGVSTSPLLRPCFLVRGKPFH